MTIGDRYADEIRDHDKAKRERDAAIARAEQAERERDVLRTQLAEALDIANQAGALSHELDSACAERDEWKARATAAEEELAAQPVTIRTRSKGDVYEQRDAAMAQVRELEAQLATAADERDALLVELEAWVELAASNIGADVDDYGSNDYRKALAERLASLREARDRVASERDAALATLARVEALPAAWRVFTGMDRVDCASDLEAALKGTT